MNTQTTSNFQKTTLGIATYVAWATIGVLVLWLLSYVLDCVFNVDGNIRSYATFKDIKLFFQSNIALMFFACYHGHATLLQKGIMDKIGGSALVKTHLKLSKMAQSALFIVSMLICAILSAKAVYSVRGVNQLNAIGMVFLFMVFVWASIHIAKGLHKKIVILINELD